MSDGQIIIEMFQWGAIAGCLLRLWELRGIGKRIPTKQKELEGLRYQFKQQEDAQRQEIGAYDQKIDELREQLHQEQLRSASMKFKIIDLENEIRYPELAAKKMAEFLKPVCTECGEPGCPGVIRCPKCGYSEHGADALTHIQDHGYCHECLLAWQFREGDGDDEPRAWKSMEVKV